VRRWFGKVPVTVLAGVLGPMHEEVVVEALAVLERLATIATQEGPSVRVRPDVLLHVGLDFEGLAT